MKPTHAWLLAALVVVGGATAAFTLVDKGSPEAESVDVAATGPKAPDFALPTAPGGSTLKLSDYKGKVVLVNFWATWCPPCRAEIPDFIAVREGLKTQGFEIIGVSLDEGGANDVIPFAQEFAIPYPLVLGNQDVVNRYGGIRGIPTSFLIDREGTIVQKWPGMIDKATLERAVKAVL
jgi:peroxiredoxin